MEQEIKELIDYCYERAESSDGEETAHDVWLEVAERLHRFKKTHLEDTYSFNEYKETFFPKSH